MDLSSLVVGVVGMIAMVMAVTDFLKRLTNFGAEKTAILTQLLVWLGAVGVVFLYSSSGDFGPSIVIGDVAVNNMEASTKLILGLAIGSAANVGFDFKKSFDNSDSASVPPLKL